MTVKPPHPTRRCIPPKAPRGHTAEHTPPPLEGDDKVVWLAAFAATIATTTHVPAYAYAIGVADAAVIALREHRAGKSGPSLYRVDK